MSLTPPPLDMPSVAALRAFEAAARQDSFSRAAEELHVTPAAVAQHVKSVEAWAHQPLFHRTARGVTLNDAGRRARSALTDAFQSLGAAAALLRDTGPGVTSLRIAALPAVAELWLTPKLADLHTVVPSADISIHALDRRPAQHEGFDMVAYYEPIEDEGEGDGDELLLAASPSMAGGIDGLDDLRTVPHLRDLVWAHHWTTWLGDDTDPSPIHRVDVTLSAMAVEAARRGEGVLVGRLSLLETDLQRGSLVEPIRRRVPTGDRLTIELREELRPSRLGDWVRALLVGP